MQYLLLSTLASVLLPVDSCAVGSHEILCADMTPFSMFGIMERVQGTVLNKAVKVL